MERVYIAIDLKSFYASVECVERESDPLTTNLVVADESRTAKTICLAVTPSLKKYGLSGRSRLFEVEQKAKEIEERTGKKLEYTVAVPRMGLYIEYSSKIYSIYLKYFSKDDITVYSIDEVFIDATDYMKLYNMTARQLTAKVIEDVYDTTGITATAGIAPNLYLCKIAMDIMAKHAMPDERGVRIAELNENSYRRKLWDHRPITDFWRVGAGYAKKLEAAGMYTMGDVARCSTGGSNDFYNEEKLYKMFGINAELLIDHAWGYEPVTIADIKAYRPQTNSISSGQVLQEPYDYEKTKLIVREMTDHLVLDLVDKRLVTDQIVLTIGYDIANLSNKADSCFGNNYDHAVNNKGRDSIGGKKGTHRDYTGEITIDRYGRKVPKHAHGTANLGRYTSSTRIIMDAVMELYDRIIDPSLLTRRITVVANRVCDESKVQESEQFEQLDLFTDYQERAKEKKKEDEALSKERKLQEAMISVKKKYGKNAMLKGMNLEEGATTISRNNQIGGHKA